MNSSQIGDSPEYWATQRLGGRLNELGDKLSAIGIKIDALGGRLDRLEILLTEIAEHLK